MHATSVMYATDVTFISYISSLRIPYRKYILHWLHNNWYNICDIFSNLTWQLLFHTSHTSLASPQSYHCLTLLFLHTIVYILSFLSMMDFVVVFDSLSFYFRCCNIFSFIFVSFYCRSFSLTTSLSLLWDFFLFFKFQAFQNWYFDWSV